MVAFQRPASACASVCILLCLFQFCEFPDSLSDMSFFESGVQESYAYKYPAPGSPELANRIISLLAEKGLRCTADASRGWDHGVFVPLMLMFPDASVPVVSLSLYSNQDASQHMEAGEALQRLRAEGVLIVGSGASFHNFGYFFASWPQTQFLCTISGRSFFCFFFARNGLARTGS